jgi:hypothetical protein
MPVPSPYIDESVEHVGVSRLRFFNAAVLRSMDKTFVFHDGDEAIAVLLSYEQFLTLQKKLYSLTQLLIEIEQILSR